MEHDFCMDAGAETLQRLSAGLCQPFHIYYTQRRFLCQYVFFCEPCLSAFSHGKRGPLPVAGQPALALKDQIVQVRSVWPWPLRRKRQKALVFVHFRSSPVWSNSESCGCRPAPGGEPNENGIVSRYVRELPSIMLFISVYADRLELCDCLGEVFSNLPSSLTPLSGTCTI